MFFFLRNDGRFLKEITLDIRLNVRHEYLVTKVSKIVSKDVSKMKCTNWLLHYFTTLSGHILANYISIFHKTEVFMNILRCQTCPNLNWIKTTR